MERSPALFHPFLILFSKMSSGDFLAMRWNRAVLVGAGVAGGGAHWIRRCSIGAVSAEGRELDARTNLSATHAARSPCSRAQPHTSRQTARSS